MDVIRKWLNGTRNYDDGIKLYRVFGRDDKLKRMFGSEGPSDFKKKKLLKALQEIVAEAPLSKKTEKAVSSPILVPAENPTVIITQQFSDKDKKWRSSRDEVEEALFQQWKPLFAELMNLTARVGDIARAGERDNLKRIEAGRMALRICDLDDELDEIYKQRDQYLQSGEKPQAFPYGEVCIDPIRMPLKLANHQRYVREYKLKLAKKPDDVKTAEQLKKHQWFVDYYSNKLKV